jgi:methionyl-tRNA formyltransferase
MTPSPSIERLPTQPGILFMGTPDFAVPTLEALVGNGYAVRAVVTQPDRPKGRGKRLVSSPVKVFALEHGLEVLQPEKASDPQFCEIVREKRPDLIIVVAFGQILRKRLLEIPPRGVINIHGSLLPAYRGAAPIQWAVLNNETRTGLTVMRMDEGLDTGPILFQEEVSIGEEETAGHLYDRLAHMAGELMVRSLRHMAENPVEEHTQDHSLATYAPKIGKEMCLVDWSRSAAEVTARIRALDPRPGAFTLVRGSELKVFASRVVDERRTHAVPGRVLPWEGGGLVVETGGGAVEIREVQSPGKKRMPVADFLRGFQLAGGSTLGR